MTFSHFLGREELIYEDEEEGRRRRRLSGKRDANGKIKDANIWFNFSRVAGCSLIDEQARQLHTVCHVHGHQHRQRDRIIDGVRYVSHCLAYPSERQEGTCVVGEPVDPDNPKLVWPPPEGLMPNATAGAPNDEMAGTAASELSASELQQRLLDKGF